MFAVVDLQTTFRVRYLGVFITKLRTKFDDFATKTKSKRVKVRPRTDHEGPEAE